MTEKDPYQITLDWRWTRVRGCSSHHEGWDQVRCFRFTMPDGKISWADLLDEEDAEMFNRQEAERAEAAAQADLFEEAA